MLSREFVLAHLGQDLQLLVNPKCINLYVGGNSVPFQGLLTRPFKNWPKLNNLVYRVSARINPVTLNHFVIPAWHYRTPIPANKTKKYRYLEDLIANRPNYERSCWFQHLQSDLNTRGFVSYKHKIFKSVEDLHDFFQNYLLDLINSMEKEGYKMEKARKLGTVMIGKNGNLHKSNAGDHRFITAKILGIPSIPLRIKGIHQS